MKYNFQNNIRSPGLIKRNAVDPGRRSFIQQSMDSILVGMESEDDDIISMESLQDIPPVTKPSIRKPGALSKDDRSTSTEVTTGLDDSSVSSFDLSEMNKSFTVLPVSPFGEVLDYQEHFFDDDDDSTTHTLNIVEKPNLRKHVSIESVDIDDFLGMPDLRKAVAPPMRRTSITIPVAPSTERPSRRSSVSFAEVAEVSFIDKLDNTTDYDSLYYTDEELADFRHKAFLEECGISDEDFD